MTLDDEDEKKQKEGEEEEDDDEDDDEDEDDLKPLYLPALLKDMPVYPCSPVVKTFFHADQTPAHSKGIRR